MRVAIIGAGYVGLVTGACLAARGHEVVCVDRDAARVRTIEEGRAPFHEPGLTDLVRSQAGGGLRATSDLAAAVRGADVTLIATGTPFDGSQIDLSYVVAAAREVGHALRSADGYHVVAVKSTVVPGTTDGVVRATLETASGKRAGVDFGLGMNPEFLSEGTAVADFDRPDRIVLGGMDARTLDVLAELYRDFDGVPVFRTSNASAELIKYASNSLLATLISFSNEIASLAALLPGVDAMEVMRGVHAMRELTVTATDGTSRPAGMTSFLSPGCGFGGSCLPKDVSALAAWGASRGQDAPLLEAVLSINRERPAHVIALLERELGSLRGQRVAVLGLAFKPDTDDVRESPAFPLIERLLARGASVRAYDPIAHANAALVLDAQAHVLAGSLAEALEGASAVVLVTRWDQFRVVPDLLRARSPAPLLVDARRMLDAGAYERYAGVGLGPRRAEQGGDRAEPEGASRPPLRRARAEVGSERLTRPSHANPPNEASSSGRLRAKGGGS